MFCEAVLLARLVEAEIMSPYHWILINTGVGKNGGSLSLYRGGENYAATHLPVKIAYFPSATLNGTVGLPVLVLMRIP